MAQSVVSAKLGPFRRRVDAILADMAQKRIAARLWAKDHRLWKPDPTEIDNRLGWLDHRRKSMRSSGFFGNRS